MSDQSQTPQHIEIPPLHIIGDKPHDPVDVGKGANHGDTSRARTIEFDPAEIIGTKPQIIEFDPVNITIPKHGQLKGEGSASESRATLSAPTNESGEETVTKQNEVSSTAEDRSNSESPRKENSGRQSQLDVQISEPSDNYSSSSAGPANLADGIDNSESNKPGGASQYSTLYELIILYGPYISELEILRKLYNDENQKILDEAKQLLKNGSSEEEAARYVVRKRNLLKDVIRKMGPLLIKIIAEIRNLIIYKNKLGPSYEYLVSELLKKGVPVSEVDKKIIDKVIKGSKGANAGSKYARVAGKAVSILGLILQATQDSPEFMEPLPVTDEKEVEIEKARLRLGLPADVEIDQHGHLKKSSYLQMDNLLDVHAPETLDQETEEILWYLGFDISYQIMRNGDRINWTAPGRE